MPVSASPLPAVLLVLACSPANSLQGSMNDLTPLAFTQVQVKLAQNQLVLKYEDYVDGGGPIPFELTVDTGPGPLASGLSFLLDGGTDAGLPVAVASRSLPADQRTFSPIERGYLNLTSSVAQGGTATGDFFVVFTYQKDESLGAGHTVYGNFSAAVTQ